MYCAPSREQAIEEATPHLEGYFRCLHEASSDWLTVRSKDYPGHPAMIAGERRDVASMIKGDALWVGTPDDIHEKIVRYQKAVGGIEHASLQVNFHTLPFEKAEASVKLFAEKVIPRLRD
jgi:alkanesulfonate monooxygenase SsuD/methylene tetrahydromethanopterin reductase-like flavin-dependent oxidoreductase (luciferase family)